IGDIHMACALTHGNWDHKAYGFDSGVEFPPHNMQSANLAPHMDFNATYSGYCPDYSDIADMYLGNDYGADKSVFRGVFPSWDNTARRGAIGTVILNGTPENYEHWLSRAVAKTKLEFPGQDRPLFINAWNEWAEGCHLEPDRKYGMQFLEATARAKKGDVTTKWMHVGAPIAPRSGIARAFRRKNYRPPKTNKKFTSRLFRAVRDFLTGRMFRR
ncbi:MAG: glycoside hydrolase family 99-like domain-containing protein, partial [Albidovulum sp.]